MSVPFSVANSKRITTNVVVELSGSQAPPTLPFELKDYVSPHIWDTRVSTLARLASQYCRPTFERAYVVAIMVLTFLVPIMAYYVTLRALETAIDDPDRQVWFARFSAFVVVFATWIVLSIPVVVWKYVGRVRVTRLSDQWTRSDALSAPSYGNAPVWKASAPGLFRDTIVLMITVPLTKKSHFDRNSCLPPYIAAGDDALPAYGDSSSRTTHWSKDLKGGIKFGDLSIHTDNSI